MRKFVVYLAHPVNAPTPEGVEANLESALEWLQWLVDHTDWAVTMPWYAYVKKLSKGGQYGHYRERGLQDDCENVKRSDAILCVGGHITGGDLSIGMQREATTAVDHHVIVGNLTHVQSPWLVNENTYIVTASQGPEEKATISVSMPFDEFEMFAQKRRSMWFRRGGPHLYVPTHCGTCLNPNDLCSCR